MKQLVIAAALLLCACGTTPKVPPEPIVKTQVVKVAVPVPCPALDQLGLEPTYYDNDQNLLGMKDIATRVSALLIGRTQRDNRLREYQSARASCQAR